MKSIPIELIGRAFTRDQALAVGVTPMMLRGQRFERVHPRVYRLRADEWCDAQLVAAARLALPGRVHLTGLTRLQHLGLDYGPRLPVRMVIEGDHHLAIDGIFLHRTKKLPPLDDVGVSVEAAFVFYCREARVVDAIKVGDWLWHHGHLDPAVLERLAITELWRPGSHEALWVLPHLAPDSWSLKESETRAALTFAGLPRPECNQRLDPGARVGPIADLLYREWRTAIEYEGRHHQEDRGQYAHDIGRYEQFRARDVAYVQVTDERLRRPQRVVSMVYRTLVSRGYDGPAPRFGEQWRALFTRLSTIVGERPEWRAGRR